MKENKNETSHDKFLNFLNVIKDQIILGYLVCKVAFNKECQISPKSTSLAGRKLRARKVGFVHEQSTFSTSD